MMSSSSSDSLELAPVLPPAVLPAAPSDRDNKPLLVTDARLDLRATAPCGALRFLSAAASCTLASAASAAAAVASVASFSRAARVSWYAASDSSPRLCKSSSCAAIAGVSSAACANVSAHAMLSTALPRVRVAGSESCRSEMRAIMPFSSSVE